MKLGANKSTTTHLISSLLSLPLPSPSLSSPISELEGRSVYFRRPTDFSQFLLSFLNLILFSWIMATESLVPAATPQHCHRQNRSSGEVAYVGPAEPLPPLPISPPLSVDSPPRQLKRARRNRGIADDEWSFERDGVIVEPFRAATPSICRLPAVLVPLPWWDPVVEWFDRPVQERIIDILSRYRVPWTSLDIGRRAWRFERKDTSELPVTIVIQTGRDHGDYKDRWCQACVNIRDSLHDVPGNAVVGLEIIDRELTRPTASSAIMPGDRIVEAWPALKTEIVAILKSTDCNELTVLRRGKHAQAEDNPVPSLSLFLSRPRWTGWWCEKRLWRSLTRPILKMWQSRSASMLRGHTGKTGLRGKSSAGGDLGGERQSRSERWSLSINTYYNHSRQHGRFRGVSRSSMTLEDRLVARLAIPFYGLMSQPPTELPTADHVHNLHHQPHQPIY